MYCSEGVQGRGGEVEKGAKREGMGIQEIKRGRGEKVPKFE